ncbi:MAG: hypothetical protein MI743_18475 [Sneathiellales bacterium]|nr:hypothetical protein [Sneathiellales bacterium]
MKQRLATLSALAVFAMIPVQDAVAIQPSTQGLGAPQEIDVSSLGGTPIIRVKNNPAGNQLNAIKLVTDGTTVDFSLKGDVECGGSVSENFNIKSGTTFRTARIGAGNDNEFFYMLDAGVSNDINIHSHSVTKSVKVPFNKFNGTSYLSDPAGLVMKAANLHAANGGNKIQYLRNDHSYIVKLPIRFEATCQKYIRKKIAKKTIYEGSSNLEVSKLVNVRIDYKGDKSLIATGGIALGKTGGGVGGFNAGQQNFISVNSGQFLIGQKNLKGKCAMEPQFKIELKGAGDGQVKIRINDGGKTLINSQAISFSKGKATYTFKTKVGYAGNQTVLNKLYAHNYKVYVKAKTHKDQFFPGNFQMVPGATLQWTHTCIKPIVLNPAFSGGPKNKIFAPKQPARPARQTN